MDALMKKERLGFVARLLAMIAAGVVGMLLVLAGLSLYQDWAFLHQARLISEKQQQLQALADAQQRAQQARPQAAPAPTPPPTK